MPEMRIGPITLTAPADWTLSSIILAGPEDEVFGQELLTTKMVRPFRRNLVATMERVSDNETVESYLKRQVKGLWEAGVNRQEATQAERVTLSHALQGIVLEQVIKSESGERIRQLQLMYIKDGVAHTIIASHLDGPPFERVREEFRSMLLSLS